MNGTIFTSILNDFLVSLSLWDVPGMALDTVTPGGPYLWVNANGARLVQIGNIYAGGSSAGVSREYINDLYTADEIDQAPSVGGLCAFSDQAENTLSLMGVTMPTTKLPPTMFQTFIISGGDMKYTTTYVQQNDTTYTVSGSVNQKMLDIRVFTNGIDNPLNIANMTFSTTGTTNPADITNAKLYYTGSNPNFSTDRLLGTFNAPSGSFNY